MNNVLLPSLTLLLALACIAPLSGATWYSQSSGQWGDAGTPGLWNTMPNGTGIFFNGSDLPGPGDDIIIQTSHQIELSDFSATGNFLEVNTITISTDGRLYGAATGVVISVHGSHVTVDGLIDYPTLTLVSSSTAAFAALKGSGSAALQTISFKHSLPFANVSIDLNTVLNDDFYPLDAPGNGFTGNFIIQKNKTVKVNGSLFLDSDARTNFSVNQYDLNSLLQVSGALILSGDLQTGNNNGFFSDLLMLVDATGSLQMTAGAIIGGNSIGGSANSILNVEGLLATAANDPIQDMNSRFFVRMNSGSICRLEGGANQLLDADVSLSTYYAVELTGAGPKVLAGDLEIQYTINLGVNLELGSYDLFLSRVFNGGFFGGTATPSTNNSFLHTNGTGRVTAWVGGGNIDFRIGNGTYANIRTTNLALAPQGYMIMSVETGISPNGPGTTTNYVNKTWHLEKENPLTNFSFNIQLYWTVPDEQSNFDRQSCWISRHDGSNWDTDGPFSTLITAVSRSNVSTFGAFSVASSGVLPVELVDFQATTVPEGHLLQWQTASEVNNSHFEVEHSTDAQQFSPVGKVTGKGDSRELLYYSWLYRPENRGATHYYRLKQVDFDGQFTYSDIVALKDDAPSALVLKLYPNPASSVVQLQIPSGSRAIDHISILSIDGRRFWQGAVAAGDQMEIPLDNWPCGTYIVCGGADGQQLREVARFIRQ